MRQMILIVASMLASLSLIGEAKGSGPNLSKEEYFKQKVFENPQSTQARYDYATELFLNEHFDRADEQLDEILKLEPRHALALGLRSGIEKVRASAPADRPKKKIQVLADQINLLQPQFKEVEETAKALRSTSLGQQQEQREAALKEDYEKRFLPLAAHQYRQSTNESKDLMGLVLQLEMDEKWNELEAELLRLKNKYPQSAEIHERLIANAQRRRNWDELKRLVKEGRSRFPQQVGIIIYDEALKNFENKKSDEQREVWSLDLLLKKSKWSQIYFNYQMQAIKGAQKPQ